MAWFKRNKTDQTVLPEIEKYYEAERHERAGLAWLLALVSVACIALLLIGLFFGGKWAFNRLTKDEPVAVTTSNGSTEVKPDGTINDGGSKDTAQQPAATTPSTPAPSTPAPSPTPTPTPSPSSNLPSTGVGNLSIVFVISALGAWFGHQVMLRRRSLS